MSYKKTIQELKQDNERLRNLLSKALNELVEIRKQKKYEERI